MAHAGAIVTFPVLALICGVLWLGLVSLLEALNRRPLGRTRRVLASAAVALGVGLVLAGPRGFTLAPGSELVNVFLLLAVPSGTLLYCPLAGCSSLDARVRPAGAGARTSARSR